MYLGKYGKYFSYLYLIFFFLLILFLSDYIKIISLESDFTNKSYWIFSSIMQTNATIVGLFFVSFGMFLSKGLNLEKVFESSVSLLFFFNTIFLVFLSIMALFGMATTADCSVNSNFNEICYNQATIKKIIFLELFGLTNTILILFSFPKLFVKKKRTAEFGVPLPQKISYDYYTKLYTKIKTFLSSPTVYFYNDNNIFAFISSYFLNINFNDFMGISALIFLISGTLLRPIFTHYNNYYTFILFLSVSIFGFIFALILKRKKLNEKYFNWILNKWGIKAKFSARKNGLFSEKRIDIIFVYGEQQEFTKKIENNQITFYYYFEYLGEIKIHEELLKTFEMMVMRAQNKEYK